MRSIGRHLTLRLLGALLALAAAAGAFLFLYVRSHLTAEFDRSLGAEARTVASLAVRDNGKLEFNPSETDLAEFRPGRHASYYELWKADGTVVARSPSVRRGHLPEVAAPTSGPLYQNITLPNGRRGRVVFYRFMPRSEDDEESARKRPASALPALPAPLFLTVAQDRHEIDQTLRVLASSLVVAALVLAATTTLVVLLTVRTGLRPLHQLGAEADAIEAQSLHARFSTERLPLELQPIGRRLNQLLARLDEAFTRERRFTADVAHELRTPIAELKSLSEVAIKWPDQAAAGQGYGDALDIANHMEALVSTLLAIARSEAGAQPVKMASVDLCDLLRDTWKRQEVAAKARHLDVRWDLPLSATIRSDRTMVLSLLGNLLANAVAYSLEGGSIDCRISPEDGQMALSISNSCNGLVPDDLPRLFDPFWRKDPARSGGLHCGLGLSLVAAYAAALGAVIRAELPEAHHFRVSIVFPSIPNH
jgi:signal transduction histidine kinase